MENKKRQKSHEHEPEPTAPKVIKEDLLKDDHKDRLDPVGGIVLPKENDDPYDDLFPSGFNTYRAVKK